jgi:hypothetical protein
MSLLISTEIENSQVRDLAKTMLAKSKEFIMDMCHFVEEFYKEMAESSAISPENAWTLTSTLLFEIFKERTKARSIVKQVRERNPLLHVWGTLKTHEVMERFSRNRFKEDPALTGILVQHIVRRKNNVDGSGQLSRKLGLLEGKVGTVTNEVKTKLDKAALVRELSRKQDK